MAGERPELDDGVRGGGKGEGCQENSPVDPSRDLLGPGLGAYSIGWYTPRTPLASTTSRAGVQDAGLVDEGTEIVGPPKSSLGPGSSPGGVSGSSLGVMPRLPAANTLRHP